MQRVSFALLALAAGAIAAAPAAAQQGPVVGIDLKGSSIQANGSGVDPASGAGVGLTLGYGLSDAFSLFVRGDMAYRATYLDLGARYRFGGSTAALRPYVQGSLTYAGTTLAPFTDEPLRSRGVGFTGAAGLEYAVAPNLALDFGVSHTLGEFVDGASEGRGFAATRLNFGVRWRP
jgi:opacity protein-like surface antigen